MQLHNLRILVKYYLDHSSSNLKWILLLYILGISLSTFAVNWDEGSVTFFGFPLELYGSSRETSLITLLNELSSWAWLIIALVYLLPNLLQRLSESLSINNTLWLRLVPCSPYEVAMARVVFVLIFATFIGVFGIAWASICAFYHQISIVSLMINIEGLVSHILLASGLILAFDVGFSNTLERNFNSFLALISPLPLILIYLSLNGLLEQGYMKFFPFVIPFNSGLSYLSSHFSVTALVGMSLLVLHIISNLKYSQIENITKD